MSVGSGSEYFDSRHFDVVLYVYGLESFVTYAPVHRNNTSSQVLAIHECTSRFLRAIFDHHIGHLYYVLPFHAPQDCIDLVFYLYINYFV